MAPAPWTRPFGYALYIGLLGAGYYYNLTFVQLGLIDLGTRVVGMRPERVSAVMAALAVAALVVAVATGLLIDRRRASFRARLRGLAGVVAGQTALTAGVAGVETPDAFLAWVMVCAVTIGAGIPLSFGLMLDLVPTRHRGTMAAAVAGLAFGAAAVYPLEWRIEEFAPVMLTAMVPATIVLTLLAWSSNPLLAALEAQRPAMGAGRFREGGISPGFALPVVLMFSVFFIDSLGFLRIIDAPAYIATSWQSPDIGTRLFIAVTHAVGAAMAGVLYTGLGRRWLFAAVFGLFAFTHLLYTSHIATAPQGIDPPLVLPLFYVLAVSFYTTLNFALWPDLSTSDDIGLRTALGVGVAGWLASFLSTALALYSEGIEASLLTHLRWVNALALLLAAGFPVVLYLRRMRRLAAESVR